MTNAKQELLEEVKDTAKIKCAFIQWAKSYNETDDKVLKLNYSKNEYDAFLRTLDFKYDSGYGGQNLFGTIWLEDGTWLSRGEYDGSEWWVHNSLPTIPRECLIII